MTPQPKLADVAARAGVSPTTVSRVLNNRGYLSQKTRDAVGEAVQELGYRPNAVARSLQQRKTNLVGIIFPSVAHPFYGQLVAEIEARLADRDHKVLLCDSDDHPERERQQLDMLLAHQVDGVITGAHSNIVTEFSARGSSLVTVDRPGSVDVPNVSCNNREITAEAVRGLLERGARRPVHLSSSRDPLNERRIGYEQAMRAAGLAPVVLRTERLPHWREDAAAVSAQLDGMQDVDAVIAGNDVLAASAYGWACSRGLRVPEEMQIVGFDGSDAVRALFPRLSTVVQPYSQIAERAVELVLQETQDSLQPGPLGAPAIEGVTDVLPASIAWNATTR